MREQHLVRYFLVYSLIAFLITAVILGMTTVRFIEKQQLASTLEITDIAVHAYLQPTLIHYDFKTPFTPSEIDDLKQKFQEISSIASILDIRIWSTQGTILYDSSPAMIGTSFPDNSELLESLGNKTVYEISRPTKEESKLVLRDNVELMEIYTPIIIDNQVMGAFEVYKSFDVIRQEIHQINITMLTIMALGLVILYFFLLRIVFKASNTLVKQNRDLEENKTLLEESYNKLDRSYKFTVQSLSRAVDARDPYTAWHSDRVTRISVDIGRGMNLNGQQLDILELAALFHDIGKIGISDGILLKPGKLTQEEYQIIKTHPLIGEDILRNIEFLKDALPIIRHHHERNDGKGYPDGLTADKIPLESRIIAVADAYDAMTTDRPYRSGMTHAEALKELQDNKGVQFDCAVVDYFSTINPPPVSQSTNR